MLILTLGALLIVIGAVSMSFPKLCESLKLNDPEQWKTLGSPNGHSFADLGGTSGVFTWVLQHGYEKSQSSDVVKLGVTALRKARFAKYSLQLGVVVGFVAVLFGL